MLVGSLSQVLDDDNWIVPSRFVDWAVKEGLDPDVPLFLGGRVGPGRNKVPCPSDNYDRDESGFNSSGSGNGSSGGSGSGNGASSSSSRNSSGGEGSAIANGTALPRWGCCGDARRLCRAHLHPHLHPSPGSSQGGAAVWAWDEALQSMAVKEPCTKMKAECCRSEPWPEGKPFRYPWRATTADDAPYQVPTSH